MDKLRKCEQYDMRLAMPHRARFPDGAGLSPMDPAPPLGPPALKTSSYSTSARKAHSVAQKYLAAGSVYADGPNIDLWPTPPGPGRGDPRREEITSPLLG
jgi:hypothetical protein